MSDIVVAPDKDRAIAVSDYGSDAGSGFEGVTSDDLSIPFLNVLQALSPEVAGEPGERVAGASAGRLMNTVTKELYPETGVIFQPCAQTHMFVEWKPRTAGGGYVGVYDQNDPIVVAAKAASKEFGKFKSPAGNDLVETIYLMGLIHRDENLEEQIKIGAGEPIIVTFQSTKLKSVKNMTYRLYTVAGKPPLFAHRMRIQTVMEKNNKGSFYNYKLTGLIKDDIVASLIPAKLGEELHPLLLAGRNFKNAAASGSLKVNYAKSKDGGAAGGSGAGVGEDDIPF